MALGIGSCSHSLQPPRLWSWDSSPVRTHRLSLSRQRKRGAALRRKAGSSCQDCSKGRAAAGKWAGSRCLRLGLLRTDASSSGDRVLMKKALT